MSQTPEQIAAGQGMSDAEFRETVGRVLDALDLAQTPAPNPTPPRIDTEEAARAAFAAGHLEDDDNEWGVYVADQCTACGHEAEHRFDIGCVAQSYSAEPMGRRCGCKHVAGGA
jgi:hypothetical protein